MSNEILKQDLCSKNKNSKISSGSEAELSAKKRDLSPSRRSSHKDDKDRSHRDHHRSHRDERHIKSSSSSHRHSSRSGKDDKNRDHRDHRRDRESNNKRHSDRHRHERSSKKNRSRSASSSSGTSEERKSKDRRHRSGSRDKTNNSRRAENSSQSKNSDKKPLNTESIADKTNAAALSVNEQEGSLNIADMLKTIHVPPEIRFKPAEAAKYQMDQLRLKTEELTGVKVPSFYNSTAVNPLQYAEQQKKRKLLWSKAKDNGVTTTSIVGRAIVEGQDEKTSEKFRKLMGIKDTDSNSIHNQSLTAELKKKQLKINEVMDKEYELARMSTHTHRGQGLGFATLGFIDPNQPQRPGH